jgi:hypothetical protein
MNGSRIMMVTGDDADWNKPCGKILDSLGDGLCRAWAIDPKNIELLELRSLVEKSMKRP